jgi:exodeoxyribonuclease VII small subunit
MTAPTKDLSTLSFEKALEELQNIVRDVELGKDPLDEILKKCERGNELRQYCEQKLQEAKLRVEKLNVPQ